jgi:hypothetical protein
VGLSFGVLIALLLLVCPGAIVARTAGLTWPSAVAVGPAVTYGVVALAIVPFGAVAVPWNGWTALATLIVVTGVTFVLRKLLARFGDREAEVLAPARGPALVVAAGVLLGAALILLAAVKGLPNWQSIPSNWDSVWHANTIRWILDTGQASPTHMGELRNVETHAALYYPSAFHALGAVLAQLTGAAPTTAYTLSSLAAAVWLFPLSAAVLTWQLLGGGRATPWRTAGAAATAAALSAAFTSVPYVEFDTASMPNMAAYGIAVPAFVLITSSLRHRDRIPLAVLALIGVFSVHITGGVVVVTFVIAWWLLDALWRPVLGRVRDFVTLVCIAAPTLAVLLPQFLGVLQQAEIITGHAFLTHQGRKKALFDAIVQHTRHLNDYPIQNLLIALAAAGFVLLLIKRIWWPAAVWALLVVSIVHSSAPFGGPIGAITGKYSDLFYSDPRRLSAVVTMLLTPMAGVALWSLALLLVAGVRRLVRRLGATDPDRGVWIGATATLLLVVVVSLNWHYFPRHRHLMGEKYDQVMVDNKDSGSHGLPGQPARRARHPDRQRQHRRHRVDVRGVAGLHPLWTHYDYPVQQGPGYHRFIFWAYADDADHDPRVAEAVHALNIRYVLTSTPVVRGFVMPDGLVSLDKSKSWAKIYDNGETRIYEWRGDASSTPTNG